MASIHEREQGGKYFDYGGSYLNVKHPSFGNGGAKGDGKTVADGAITTGTPTLTSATAGFTASDVGKLVNVAGAATPTALSGTVTATAGAATFSVSQAGVLVNGSIIVVAGVSYTLSGFNGSTTGTLSGSPTFGATAFGLAIPLGTTILAFVNSTTVTLATNAGTTVSAARVAWATDDTDAFEDVMVAAGEIVGKEIRVPDGLYMIKRRLLDQTSAGRLIFRAPGHRRAIIMAHASMTQTQMLRVGNNTGHGVYQLRLYGIGFDGGGKTLGNTGLMLHEAGLSEITNFAAENCGTAAEGPGIIGTKFGGLTYIATCGRGIICTRPVTGTPADAFDITKTSSPLSLSTNNSGIEWLWATAVDGEVVHAEGGLFSIRKFTIQSCGSSINTDLIVLNKCNESFDYGGGPVLDNGWVEGGTYRYAVRSIDTRGGTMRSCIIMGSSTNGATDFPKEGGVLLEGSINGSSNWNIDGSNSIRGFFVATPTEGRLANAALYVTPLSKNYKSKLEPYTVKTQCKVYFEGVASPQQTKSTLHHRAYIKITAGVATITSQTSDFINSFTRNAAGDWTITYKFNRDAPAAGGYDTWIQPHSSSATKAYGCAIFGDQGAGNERVIFKTTADVQEDPWGFSLLTYGEINTV